MSLTRIDSPQEVVQRYPIKMHLTWIMDTGGTWECGCVQCVLLNLNYLIRCHIITLLVTAISIVLPHCHTIKFINCVNMHSICRQLHYCSMEGSILCNGHQKTNYVSFVYYEKKLKKRLKQKKKILVAQSMLASTFTFYAGRQKCNMSRILLQGSNNEKLFDSHC